MNKNPVPTFNDPLLTRADVLRITTLGATKFKELVRAGKFPLPVQISPHRVAWRTSAVQAYIDALPIADAYQDVNHPEATRCSGSQAA
jgi:predicted DNA-binding transcriptional regulator AlpA